MVSTIPQFNTLPAPAIRELRRILESELPLHQELSTLLEGERKAVIGTNIAEVERLQAKRITVNEKLSVQRDRRTQWVSEWLPGFTGSLTSWVEKSPSSPDRLSLLELLRAVRTAAKSTHQENLEYQSLLNFNLKVVSGCISLLWSATNNVVRSYNKKGTIKERMNPRSDDPVSRLGRV